LADPAVVFLEVFVVFLVDFFFVDRLVVFFLDDLAALVVFFFFDVFLLVLATYPVPEASPYGGVNLGLCRVRLC
jgi:hypothetical protein